MSKVGHNRIQLGDDSDPNKNFVIGTPSPNDGTLEVRKGTVEVPGDLVARFTGTNLELGATGQAIKSAAFLDVVGTVSQVGGVPTGAIIQTGANANGTFVRFADGTQFCRHTLSFPLVVGTTSIPWTFPASFSATPTALVQMVTSLPEVVRASPGTPSLGDVNIYGYSTFAGPAFVAAFVIGRWY